MSGSSRAERALSRCVVALDAGVSISWAADPDGSFDSGARHHQEEEASFLKRLDAGRAGIEVLFDELEAAGRVFVSPTERAFRDRAETGSHGALEHCEVRVACTPNFSRAELTALAARIAGLVAPVAEVEVTVAQGQGSASVARPAVVSKPWWKVW